MKAYTRSKKIASVQYIMSQIAHAQRKDRTSKLRVREDAEPGTCLSWSLDQGPKPDFAAPPPRPNYLSAYKAWKAENGVSERKSAPLGLHLLVGVSPEWVTENGGGLHDPANLRNQQLMEAAIDWANAWSKGGVYAARLDLDEKGGAVVDLFVSPPREQRYKRGSSKLVVSVNKALEELSEHYFEKKGKHYAALNSSWADYAALHLDARLERGTPKSITKRDHIPPDAYRHLMQEATAEKAAAAAALADAERAKREAEDLLTRQDQIVAEKVAIVVSLAVRTIVGVATGKTTRSAKGTWEVNLNQKELDTLMPFISLVKPGLEAVESVVTSVKDLFGTLTGLAKDQATKAVHSAKLPRIFLKPEASDDDPSEARQRKEKPVLQKTDVDLPAQTTRSIFWGPVEAAREEAPDYPAPRPIDTGLAPSAP